MPTREAHISSKIPGELDGVVVDFVLQHDLLNRSKFRDAFHSAIRKIRNEQSAPKLKREYWDVVICLFKAHLTNTLTVVSDIYLMSTLPESTVKRHLRELESVGVVEKYPDVTDKRRQFVVLKKPYLKILYDFVKECAEEFQDSLETAQDIIHETPFGMLVFQYVSPDKLVLLDGNSVAEKEIGICIKEQTGKELNEIWPFAREHGLTDFHLGVARSGMPNEMKDTFYSDEQVTGFFSIRSYPLPRGKLVVSFENITERKKIEQELTKYRNHYEEALESEKKYSTLKRRFVSLIGHVIRTPLTIIDGAAQRIIRTRNNTSPDQLAVRGKQIRNAVRRMVELTEITVLASRLDDGKIKMKSEFCDLKQILHDVYDTYAEFSPFHNILVDIDGLPERIKGDPKLLEHVFTNLVSNALKYAPDSALIEVRGWSEDGRVSVSVTDHGIGIAREDLPNVFERYFRAKTAKDIQGTGIGLSVCKELVDMHGGMIEVASVKGEGATFTVRLPDDVKVPRII